MLVDCNERFSSQVCCGFSSRVAPMKDDDAFLVILHAL